MCLLLHLSSLQHIAQKETWRVPQGSMRCSLVTQAKSSIQPGSVHELLPLVVHSQPSLLSPPKNSAFFVGFNLSILAPKSPLPCSLSPR